MTERVKTGVAHIDASILLLEHIDRLSNELFRTRLSPEDYRQQVAALIGGMNEQTLRMFAATYVDEDTLDDKLTAN